MASSLALSAFLAGCGGSVLDPADVARANASVAGGNVPGGGVPVVDPDGPGAPVDPADPGDPADPSAPGAPAGPGDPAAPAAPGGPAAPGSPSSPGSAAPPTGKGVRAGSCAGFKNTTGITDTTITIGNIADISGPVPGIFTAARDAVKAYVKYFNANSTICGRKLEVKAYDSQTNTSADAVATQKTCDETFAAVGSMSAFDSGGAAAASQCKIPEIHAIVTNPSRAACDSCFGAEAPLDGYFQQDLSDYFTKTNKAATQKAAMLYANAGAAVNGAKTQVKAHERRGWKFSYVSVFDIAEFNFGPYVQRMKAAGVRIVEMFGSADMAVRMARSMQSAGFKPDIFLLNATQYDPVFASGGSAVEGAIIYVDFKPIEEMSSSPELQLYNKWLQQVAPGSRPTYFGLFAWSSARLFAEQATKLGGNLTRANLVTALKGVHDWTSNNLHAPQDVGRKIATKCVRFLQLRNGTFKPYGPTNYLCSGRVSGR